MSAGTGIEQRSIILVPFPFSDLTGAKKRPALVVSSSDFNIKNDDVICKTYDIVIVIGKKQE